MRIIWISLVLAIPFSGITEEVKEPSKKICAPKKRCESSVQPRDATVLSMMGWGVALAVGIATICVLLKDNPESALKTTSTTTTTTTGG